MSKFVGLAAALSAIAFMAAGGYASAPKLFMPDALSPSCTIKGNVSMDIGERICHVPGQMFYADTAIFRNYGERCFCSENEARKAGWESQSGKRFDRSAYTETRRRQCIYRHPIGECSVFLGPTCQHDSGTT